MGINNLGAEEERKASLKRQRENQLKTLGKEEILKEIREHQSARMLSRQELENKSKQHTKQWILSSALKRLPTPKESEKIIDNIRYNPKMIFTCIDTLTKEIAWIFIGSTKSPEYDNILVASRGGRVRSFYPIDDLRRYLDNMKNWVDIGEFLK
ncbi:hypothetical protein HKBW3S25_01403 [Candidatus Hakubella thermalkaliphila]|uniref:Uncharacterized protein n=1 Tax=Candidatus Hakubella thermalkaliphila TaxID=2754717 RepID=A0A6V8P077_9ACTN|nr:hypothetical protein HKBW3S25_01403 [Candidatus Hakubella thermalkaliphila]